ncbi:Carbonic anhydrase precursor [compost metagenome]
MFSSFARKLSLLPLLALSLPVLATDAHWTYKGDSGPTHWGELVNAQCANGHAQSPIDIDLKHLAPQKVASSDLKISYSRSPATVLNNGHTIQIIPAGENHVVFKGDAYQLVQFHFHTPSEHLFDHKAYPMEMHLVNQDKDGHLLVLGVMVKEGKANKELANLWKSLPREQGQESKLTGKSTPNLAMLLPKGSKHIYYSGSLTTPPCSEGVQWVVFEKPIVMSHAQIERFRQIFPDNHRPAQALDGREVDQD